MTKLVPIETGLIAFLIDFLESQLKSCKPFLYHHNNFNTEIFFVFNLFYSILEFTVWMGYITGVLGYAKNIEKFILG